MLEAAVLHTSPGMLSRLFQARVLASSAVFLPGFAPMGGPHHLRKTDTEIKTEQGAPWVHSADVCLGRGEVSQEMTLEEKRKN